MAEGFALSSQQRRIWQLTERGGMLVRNTLVATLHGVEEHILREAIDIVCVHHEMFKVKFLHQPGLKFPSQVLADDTPDFQSGKAESDGSEIVPIIFSIKPAANGAKSFSMEIHPLYGDSTSLKILWQDISQCYVALQNGEDGAKHFQERFQYIDYSEWQQELAAEPTFSEAGKKWKKIIASERFYETLPFERVPKGPGRIQCGSMELPPMIAGDLERYSNQYQVDVDALMLLNWYRLLTSFNKKILIGSKSPMRYRAELQSVVGPMEKYFPTVINVDQGGFSDQALHLQELISVIASEPESFDLALFGDEQTNFHYLFESIALPSAKEDLPWECQQITDGLEPFRLKLSCCKQDDRPAQIRLYYDDAFYDDRTVQNLLVCFVSRMEEVLKGNDWSTGNIEAVLIDQITKRTIVPPARTTVVERFEFCAQQYPKNIAVTFGDIRLTYEEVNERAQAMAMVLMEEWDIGVGSVVAIHLERSENLICVLLAILKTGACYLPMDLYAPEMRKKMIVEDATPDLIITDGRVSWAGERPVFTWQDLRDQIVSADRANHKLPLVKPESLAYIIYTSGTTGKPKGVCIQHKGLNNYVHWFNHAFNIQTTDQTLLLSSIAYDLCYSSLWTAIVAGGTLHVLSENQSLDAEQCVDTIRQWPITYLKMTPSHLKVLLQDGEFLNVLKKSSVKMILLGGERIDTGDVEVLMKVNPNIRIVNHYGPTETTIGTIAHEFGAVDLESFCKGPVIGKPIYNAKAFVLDSALNPVPIGQPGELYISGDGLAQGYFRSPTLTAERFIQHPQYGERLYKTGDMVKLLPDQTMSYLGRVDHQIKVRGNRVELEEIESVFNNFTSVVKCVVKYEKRERSDDHVIVAYLKVNDLFKETELVAHATQYLPAYMMPDLLITLREFPLNANGKVDRNALSHIGNESAPEKRGLTLPETETEKRLVDIWKDVLMRDKIGIDDSFFDAGGHSLLAAKLIARIHTGLKVKISLKNIFDMLTIRKLAAFIDRQAKEMSTAIKPVKQQVYYDVSPAQRQIWTLSQLSDDSSVFNMPKAYVLEGRIDRELFAKAIDAVCQRHESLRTTFIEVNHEPKQVIHEMGALPEVLTLHDMSASADTGEQIAVLLKKDSHSPFDLVRGPLFRATLVKAKNDLHVFIYNMHHIISDAWSKEIIWKEVMLWYNALLQNKPSPLAPLEIQYKDYVYWLKANDHNIANDRSYWLNLFEEAPEPLELPTDYDRPKIKTTNGDANGFGLGVDLSMKVADFAKSSHVSLFTVLMTGLKVLLLRCTNQNDIVVGTPVSGRSHEQLHDQVGLYLNNLAIRTKLDQKATFLETLEECKKNILNAFEHQAYPFDLLLQEINFKRDFSRSPLYDVVAVLGSHDFSGEVKATTDIPGVNPKSLRTGFRKSIVDLRFVFVESERQGITFLVEYNKDLYKESTITQLGNKFIMLMDTVMTSPLMRLDEIPFDLPGEALAAPGEAVEETFNFSF